MDLAAKTNWFVTKQITENKSEKPEYGQPRGKLRCIIPKSEHVYRDNSDRSGEPDWIYVAPEKKSPNQSCEWNYRGALGPGWNNRYQNWNRHGCVYVGKLKPVRDPRL